MKKIIATIEIWKEGGMFTSYCPELDIASCGHTPDEAKKNLKEVIAIQLEETAKLGTLKDLLAEAGYAIEDEVLKTEKKIVGFEELSISVGVL
jgi:predicted RNase H-like HicB family nuclease